MMNSQPIRRVSDTERKTKEDRRTPPPEEFRDQLKAAEIDPEQQGRWKRLQQQLGDAEGEPPPPPMGLFSSFEGSTPVAVQPESQATLGATQQPTSPAPTPVATTPSSTSAVQPSQQVYATPVTLDPTADLPSLSSNFWHLEDQSKPPEPTTSSTTSSTTDNDDDEDRTRPLETQLSQTSGQRPSSKERTTPKSKSAKTEQRDATETSSSLEAQKGRRRPETDQRFNLEDEDQLALEPSDLSKPQDKTKSSKRTDSTSTKTSKKADDEEATLSPERPRGQEGRSTDSSLDDGRGMPSSQPPPSQLSSKSSSDTGDATKVIALTSFPPAISTAAALAAESASSYLNPEMKRLFATMVGAVMQKTEAGVNRTEILLNMPTLKTSTFYGSKITLEKYATAPSSYNIALTGGNRAVTLFNANLPALYQAFQRGNFDFTIGNLRAYYSEEDRPLFKRKGPVGDDKGGQQGQSGKHS